MKTLPDNTMALAFSLQPDSDIDGNVEPDDNGNTVYSTRTLNLSSDLVRDLTASGISSIEVTYGQTVFQLNLHDFTALEGFDTMQEFRVVIEPVTLGESVQPEEGVLIVTNANGAQYRVKVLAVIDGLEQQTPLMLPGLAEAAQQ